jgi:hypothetical protein
MAVDIVLDAAATECCVRKAVGRKGRKWGRVIRARAVVMILRVVVLDVVRVNMAGCQFERASLMKGVRWDCDPRGVGADAIS